MKNNKFKINGNIVIYCEEKAFKSKIEDIREDCILINVPLREGAYLEFELGQEVEMNYQFGNYYYQFKTKIIGREKDNNVNLYKIELPYDLIKIQRRDFVRVDLIENLFIKKENDHEENWYRAIILNLSGGGMRVSITETLIPGEKVIINLYLDEDKIQILGKIVRAIEKRGNNQIYGVEFIKIKEFERDKIIKKVFSQIRKQSEVV